MLFFIEVKMGNFFLGNRTNPLLYAVSARILKEQRKYNVIRLVHFFYQQVFQFYKATSTEWHFPDSLIGVVYIPNRSTMYFLCVSKTPAFHFEGL